MTSSSVSFRISRHTQDLAETVHALSQRLVAMEQRFEALEAQLHDLRLQPRQAEEEEAASLAPIEAHIERLLQDCRLLLVDQPSGPGEVGQDSGAVEGEAALPVEDAVDEPVEHAVNETETGEARTEVDDGGDPHQDAPEFAQAA
jgi:hypothetical protein